MGWGNEGFGGLLGVGMSVVVGILGVGLVL